MHPRYKSDPTVTEELQKSNYNRNVLKARADREGLERINKDGSISTHLMLHSRDPRTGKFIAYPSLFPGYDTGKDTEEWHEFTKEEDPTGELSFIEAKKRGEIYEFDTEEEAKTFAEGGWKPVEKILIEDLKKIK